MQDFGEDFAVDVVGFRGGRIFYLSGRHRDEGPAADVVFSGDGSWTYPVPLALDGTADGAHTVAFQASDGVGNVSAPATVSFTLDTQAPIIAVDSPAAGGIARDNVAVAGHVHDALSGVQSLTAQVDAGPAFARRRKQWSNWGLRAVGKRWPTPRW